MARRGRGGGAAVPTSQSCSRRARECPRRPRQVGEADPAVSYAQQSLKLLDRCRAQGVALGDAEDIAAGLSSVRLIGRLEQARTGMQPWQHTVAVRTLDDRLGACGTPIDKKLSMSSPCATLGGDPSVAEGDSRLARHNPISLAVAHPGKRDAETSSPEETIGRPIGEAAAGPDRPVPSTCVNATNA